MKAWFSYAAAGLVLTLLAALVATSVVDGDVAAVWWMAGLAYVMQLLAFAAMLALRSNAQLFMIGWGAGIMMRFGVVGAVAFVVSRTRWLPLDVTLISLVMFLFLLLMLEPVFLRRGRA